MLDEALKEQIKKKFSKELKGDVKVILFGKDNECTFCLEYKELAEELAALSDNLSAEHYPVSSPEAKEHGIELAPSLLIYSPEHKTSAAFCGPPGNHFFPVLLEDIVDASRGGPNISKDIIEKAKAIDFPVKFRVFVSQSCPHCPPAVKVAHDFSLINPRIKAEMIDTALFREVAQKYRVRGVPKTVINDKIEFSGATPSTEVLSYVLRLKEQREETLK